MLRLPASLLRRVLLPLLLVLLAPLAGRADEVGDLVARLEAAGARVVRVAPGDARLQGSGRVTTGLGADGRVEVYLPEGGQPVRTPLRTPTERLTVEQFRQLTDEIRAAVRQAYGVEVERVYVAGSSSGIPFRDPATNELRTFDRKGPRTSDYDGALVSRELYELVVAENPRAVRGKTTGLRTPPDPTPRLREAFHALSERWGRKVAAMIYASEAEFRKRMELTGLEVGRNTMPEPPPAATSVEVTRAELVGALVEAEQLRRRVASEGAAGARALLQSAGEGSVTAAERLRALRLEATNAVLARGAELGEVERALLANEARRLEAPQPFAPARPVSRAPPADVTLAEAEAREVFDRIREGSIARALERLEALPAGARPEARAGLARLGEAALEVVSSPELVAEYRPETNSVRVSTGLLGELAREGGAGEAGRDFRRKGLGLVLGHELGHAAGIRGEAVADAEAVRALERAPGLARSPLTPAEAGRVVGVFSRGGGRLSDALYALRNLPSHGLPSSRADRFTRAIEGVEDPLGRFRRPDGTLDWRRLSADRALQHGAGAAHFALALFLKELAVVVKTGDRARIDEFFDGLLTTDFFVTYGLFAAGARAGDVAYSRFLARHVKPRFASAILRNQVVLATGLALPAIVRGEFDGETFVIDLGALGLSSAAVRAGLAGIGWVFDLRRAEAAGQLARAGSGLRRLARAGSFFYTAAETAVVLYLGDEIARATHEYLDERRARGAVADRTLALLEAARRPDGDPARFAELVDELDEAHGAWRDLLLRPLDEAEATYRGRLERAAREAKKIADGHAAAVARLERTPALRAYAIRRHGSVAAYADAMVRGERAEVEADLERAMEALERSRADAVRRAYEERRRDEAYLPSARRAPSGALAFFHRYGLRSEAGDVSENRLQAYGDEVVALEHALALVGADPARREVLERAIERTREVARRERALMLDEPAPAARPAGSRGLTGALEER